MSSPNGPAKDEDEGADTQMFRKFVEREETESPKAVGAPFRLLTLAVGLLVLAGIIWLMLK